MVAIISCIVNGARQHSADLVQGDLEVPCSSLSYLCSLSFSIYIRYSPCACSSLISACFCCCSSTFATLELVAVIQLLGIVIITASSKNSKLVVYIITLHQVPRQPSRIPISKYKYKEYSEIAILLEIISNFQNF